MANRNAGAVIIKLDLRGQEEMKRRLEELGPAGQRMWRDMSRGARPAKQQFKAFDEARKEVQRGVDDLASRAGPLGSFLTSIGPWGLAAAAGLGVLALALREVFVLMERSRETAFWAEELENIERASGLAADRLLSIGSAAQLAGADFDAVLSGMEEFSKRLGEYRTTGQGEGRDAYDALGLRELVDSGADATTVLDAVLERMQEIEDPSRRLSIADKLGLREAAPLLQRSGDEMARILAAADGINAAFSDDVLNRFADAGAAIREAELRRTRAQQLQSLATADLAVDRAEALARLDEARASMTFERQSMEARTLEQLNLQRAVLENQIDRLQSVGGAMDGLGVSAEVLLQQHQRITEEIERRGEIQQRQQNMLGDYYTMLEAWGDRPAGGGEGGGDDDALSTERRRELESLVEQSLRSLMTPLEEIRQLEADLTDAREADLDITEAQIATIIRNRLEAEGLAGKLADLSDEERKLAGAVDDTVGPLERQKDLLESLTAPAEEARTRLADLYALWAESPEHADVIIADIERVKNALHGPEDSNEIRMSGRVSGLRKMAEDYADLREQFERGGTRSLQDFGDFLTDISTGAADAGDAFEDMGRRIINTLAEIAIQQAIISPLAGAFDTFLSGMFGGAGGGKGTSLPKHDTGASYSLRGNPGVDRNLISVNNRPAFWASSDERLDVVPVARARAGGGPSMPADLSLPPLQIELVDKREGGGKARATERRSSDGRRQLQIMLEDQTAGAIGRGAFDREMESRYGLTPQPGRR